MNSKQTILFAEDSEEDRVLMQIAFRRAGFRSTIQVVRDGVEAISYLAGDEPYSDREKYRLPSIMVLDLRLPLRDGLEVIEWVRLQSDLRRLPIIVLTGSLLPGDVERAFDLGANSFLVKPSSLDELVKMMRAMRDWLHFNYFPPLNETVGQADYSREALSSPEGMR